MRNDRLPKTASCLPILLCCFSLSLLVSCLPKSMISSHWIAATELQPASYTVIRYRDLAVDYLTAVAFLDLEGDSYTIEPKSAPFTYRVSNGLKTEEALQLAENFVRSQLSYNVTEIKAIMDPAGNLLGYEVRPLYQPVVYGNGDVLDISYTLRPENKIEVWVRLKERIDQILFHDTRN